MPSRWMAEYEPQAALLLHWPCQIETWGSALQEVEQVFMQIVLTLQGQGLIIACHDAACRDMLQHRLREQGISDAGVALYVCPYDDIWVRDYGPFSVVCDGQSGLLDFQFDGWGHRYPSAKDDRVSRTLHALGAFGTRPLRRIDRILEGGGVETDGQGTILSTRSYLARSLPGCSMSAVQAELRHYLGCRRLLCVEEGQLSGDDTDGHIDMLVRFVAPDTLLYTACDDPGHPDYPTLKAMARQLGTWCQHDGTRYRLLPLPVPPWWSCEVVSPRNYTNFLISNRCVLVPGYGDSIADAKARQVLQSCFPRRRVVQLQCTALMRQGGGLHCAILPIAALTYAKG